MSRVSFAHSTHYSKTSGTQRKQETPCSLFPIPFFIPDAYLIFALASLTAATKNNPVSGMLSAKIIAVV
ncbi:hypothetical protein NUACC26_060050 [Scytonema sp. NUACC26]